MLAKIPMAFILRDAICLRLWAILSLTLVALGLFSCGRQIAPKVPTGIPDGTYYDAKFPTIILIVRPGGDCTLSFPQCVGDATILGCTLYCSNGLCRLYPVASSATPLGWSLPIAARYVPESSGVLLNIPDSVHAQQDILLFLKSTFTETILESE